jgi:hypothetical protein
VRSATVERCTASEWRMPCWRGTDVLSLGVSIEIPPAAHSQDPKPFVWNASARQHHGKGSSL